MAIQFRKSTVRIQIQESGAFATQKSRTLQHYFDVDLWFASGSGCTLCHHRRRLSVNDNWRCGEYWHFSPTSVYNVLPEESWSEFLLLYAVEFDHNRNYYLFGARFQVNVLARAHRNQLHNLFNAHILVQSLPIPLLPHFQHNRYLHYDG